jgi:hypothetical protein
VPAYSFLALPVAIASGVVWLIVLTVFMIRNRKSFRVWIAKVEPWHIVALGLLIAAIGVVWQQSRASPMIQATQSAPTSVVPAVQYVTDQNISVIGDGTIGTAQPIVMYRAVVAETVSRLRIFGEPDRGNPRILLADRADVVKGEPIQLPIISSYQVQPGSEMLALCWNDIRAQRQDENLGGPGPYYKLRLLVIGPDGREQSRRFIMRRISRTHGPMTIVMYDEDELRMMGEWAK